MRLRDVPYLLASDRTAGLLRTVRGQFRCRRERIPRRRVTCFDTFDWRLHHDGGYLAHIDEPNRARLEWRSHDGTLRHRQPWPDGDPPAFATSFPPGPFREALVPILEMRRLLPIVESRGRAEILHLLGDEDKTVARLRLETGTARSGDISKTLPAVAVAMPVRGYEAPFTALVSLLEGRLGLARADGSELARALSAVGREAGLYSSKPKLDLDPEGRSDAALVAILRALLDILLANEDGTRRDLDSELLHDFRVAVRRTRSVLSQLRRVLPAERVRPFREELRWLQGVTGPTRDLDVYLLKMDAYRATLPPRVRGHLGPLEDFLRLHQHQEQRRLAETLGSDRYRALIDTWRSLLDRPRPDAAAAPDAARPIRDLAAERIWRAYRRVWKNGRAIAAESPPEALHRLRIDCKKLRYLLEVFRSLYDTGEIDALIRALKRLQDNLGDFNDYEVQQKKLGAFARQMREEADVPSETLMAMGRLVATLEEGQARERRRFGKRFARFTRPERRRTFRRLFRAAGRPEPPASTTSSP